MEGFVVFVVELGGGWGGGGGVGGDGTVNLSMLTYDASDSENIL